MDRRKFISSIASGVIIPTILPSCVFRAKSPERRVKHVVFCLFAGGIRNFESIQKSEGNLMPYLLEGNESISSDIISGIESLSFKSGVTPLEKQGTLYKEFRYKSDETIHYSGHAAAITGNYKGQFQIMKPLAVPTIFELYRKHADPSPSALDTWWITDQAGPFSFLNYSNHEQYGPQYGANMLHPLALYNLEYNDIDFFSNTTLKQVEHLKKIMEKSSNITFNKNFKAGIINSDEDRYRIERFILDVGKRIFSVPEYNFWNLGSLANHDIVNMYTACEVLKTFKPKLLVVNMQNTDIGHSDFTSMCNNLQKADFALAQLWNTIQSTPGMKDDTVLIAAPEFGRNITGNTIIDQYGRYAVDHTGDENSKKIFCLIMGPEGVVRKNQQIKEVKGETIDIVPTIAHLLGFHHSTPKSFIHGKFLEDAFY